MIVLALSLAGQAFAQVTEIGVSEGRLTILSRPGYIERGATDPRFDWVTSFEKASGCKVDVETATTSDEVVARMQEGDVDLVVASGDASLRLVAAGRVQPVNVDLIESWSTVDDRLKDAAWHTVGDIHYGVPFVWGANVLLYDTRAFQTAPASWKVVFEETVLGDGKSNMGRVQAFADPIYIADAALYLMTHRPDLGIQNPYELDEVQYQAALDLLRRQWRLVGRYWHDPFIQIEDFEREGVAASGSWPFQVNRLEAEGRPVASAFPEEGVTGWADTTMMHVDADNPNCAYRWMEHTLSSNLQSDLSVWYGANPAVPAACTDGRGMQTAEGCRLSGFEDFDRVWFSRTPTSKCPSRGDRCVPYHRWTIDYLAVIAGR